MVQKGGGSLILEIVFNFQEAVYLVLQGGKWGAGARWGGTRKEGGPSGCVQGLTCGQGMALGVCQVLCWGRSRCFLRTAPFNDRIQERLPESPTRGQGAVPQREAEFEFQLPAYSPKTSDNSLLCTLVSSSV